MTVNKMPESTSIMVVDDTPANAKMLVSLPRRLGRSFPVRVSAMSRSTHPDRTTLVLCPGYPLQGGWSSTEIAKATGSNGCHLPRIDFIAKMDNYHTRSRATPGFMPFVV